MLKEVIEVFETVMMLRIRLSLEKEFLKNGAVKIFKVAFQPVSEVPTKGVRDVLKPTLPFLGFGYIFLQN